MIAFGGRKMGNLVAAINNLGQRTWVDYIAIFAPVILSVVAVWVSISTARKQSKIALFEKRYEPYTWIYLLIKFGKDLMAIKDEDLITLDEKGRARHYLILFWWRANFDDFYKFPNMIDSYRNLWYQKTHYGYQINGANQHVLISLFRNSAEEIQKSLFLFPRSTQDYLRNVAKTYKDFVLSVVDNCDLNSDDNSYKQETAFNQKMSYDLSTMENRRKEFQEAIKKADDKKLLFKCKSYYK